MSFDGGYKPAMTVFKSVHKIAQSYEQSRANIHMNVYMKQDTNIWQHVDRLLFY